MIEKLKPQQTKHIIQIIIGLFAIFLFYTLRIFMDAFLGAVIIYVLFRPMMRYLNEKRKWKKWLSAVVIIISSLLVVIVPLWLIVSYVIPRLLSILSDSTLITSAVSFADEKMMALTGKKLLSAENIQALSQSATAEVTSLLGTTVNVIGDIVIMYFLLYYLLTSSETMQQAFEDYVPFSHENIQRFMRELEGMTYANALGSPLLACVQSLAAIIGFKIFGVSQPIFWGIMCGLCSFVPAVGSSLIWGPAVIIKFTQGDTWPAVGLLLFAIIFIVAVENILRIVLQKKMADVHPIITILGFIIGIQLFGLPGIIFGPLLLSWFLLLIEIYKDEFIKKTAKKEHHSG